MRIFDRTERGSGRRATARAADRQRGAMLIIALGVLALMVILGTAFASIMRLEKRAASNYIEATRMKMLLDSALNRVIADLQGAKNSKSFTFYKDTPWLYLIKGEQDLGHGRAPVEDPRVGKWEIFAEQAGQVYSYKNKIIDCSSQINLNGKQDTLARMLDYLGEAIEQSPRLKLGGRKVTNPFYTAPNRGGDKVRGIHILQLRRRLPGSRFSSKTQLIQLIGPENYDLVKDFVTVHSWEDPDTYKPTDGMDEVIDPFGLGATSVAGGGRALGGGGGAQKHPTAYMTASRIDPEPRHPININTAPPEVLVAVLRGLAGRRVFPFSRLGVGGGGMVQVDQNASITGERIVAKEEYRDVTPRAVFVYTQPLEYMHAQRIADRIVAQRKIQPFMTWRTNNASGQKGFEDFIDDLEQSFFPGPQRAEIVDTDQPLNASLNGMIKSGNATSPIGRLWVKGHAVGAERQLRKELSLPMHDQYAWYYDLIKGVIKANFNPNTRINRYNPNVPAFIPVDKSDLVWLKTRSELLKGHTTEFCFDTMGIYEITTLGRIKRTSRRGGGSRTVVSGQPAADAFERPDYEKRFRSVVKIFDVMRHTNQFQLERTFLSQSMSSKKDRKNIVTWPDPMGALTELGSAGSPRDGRVEMAGMNDARRLQMPPNMRFQTYMSYPSVRMAQGFQDRSAESITRLKRVRLQGTQSLLKDEYTDALQDVFDANYSRIRSTDAKYYRRNYIVQLGGVANQEAQWYDPQIRKEVLGTDLFPDGLNSSIKRMSHLAARHLVLPARRRIGDAAAGGGNSLIGESGVGSKGQDSWGNVPYYRGGLSFWVKFEFDGDDPVFSGLIGCTQVIKMVSPNKADYKGSEGTQFYMFKNSEGYLRVVRMYYHQAFLEGGGGAEGGGDAGAAISLYPDPGMVDANAGGATMHNPILDELDPWKIVSRSDLVLDVRHFKAHEWHHLALDWDDQNPVFPIRVYVDFTEAKEAGSPRKPQAVVDGTANSWVRLNVRQPRDGLEVGGIVRNQAVSDAGVFKWFTNSISSERGAGVRTIAPSVKRILANATIDELITYEGTFGGAKRYYGGVAGTPGYFTNQPGEYANVFEIPLPPDVTSVVLRSFDWTSYYPTTYTDSRFNSVPQKLQQTPMRCRLLFRSPTTPPAEFQEPWRNPSIPNLVSGRRAYAGVGSIEKRQKAEVVYKFTMNGAASPTGNTAGGVVQTPVIDDVTLTYFLPSPKILAQEEDM